MALSIFILGPVKGGLVMADSNQQDIEADDKKRDEVLRRMLNTPPKPRKDKGDKKSGDSRRQPSKS